MSDLPRQNDHLAVVEQIRQEPSSSNDHDHRMSLPPELWHYITNFLDHKDLSRLYLVNHVFYNAFLDLNYRNISFGLLQSTRMMERDLARLITLQNPEIAKKVQSLRIDAFFFNSFVWALTSGKRPLPDRSISWSIPILFQGHPITKEAIEGNVQRAMSNLCNVTDLSLHLFPSSNHIILRTLWATCSRALVNLKLYLNARLLATNDAFVQGITCPRLRSLQVVYAPQSPPYPELLAELHSLIPEDGGHMEELSIHMGGHQPHLVNTSLGSLKKLRLYSNLTNRGSMLHLMLPFVTDHRDNIQELTLRRVALNDLRHLVVLNNSILTSLIVDTDAFLACQDEVIPFLSRCTRLRTLKLLPKDHSREEFSGEQTPSFTKLLRGLPQSLTHLTLSGLIFDFELFLSISQCMPNLFSLILFHCYPANHDIARHFSHEGMDPAQTTQKVACAFRVEGFVARLRGLAGEDMGNDQGECNQETISKLIIGSLTHSSPCCGFRWHDEEVLWT